MNCQTFQRVLLDTEDPKAPPPALHAHLSGCEECRQFQNRLVQIENHLDKIPVPPSQTKEPFIQSLQKDGPLPSSPNQTTSASGPTSGISTLGWIIILLVALGLLVGLIFLGILLGNYLVEVFAS